MTRPRTPNDNPFSEAQFRTMKYRPMFPASFAGIDDARAFCVEFFAWHNGEHRHSGIGFHTPASVYYGTAKEVRRQRAVTLDAAFAAHPERFVAGRPTPPALPDDRLHQPTPGGHRHPLILEPNCLTGVDRARPRKNGTSDRGEPIRSCGGRLHSPRHSSLPDSGRV